MFDIAEFHRISPKWARNLHHYEELASTNDEALRLAENGAEHGTVVLADQQHAGRGRRGTVWSSSPSDGLLFSLILRPEYARNQWSRLALASGLGMATALKGEWGVPAEIKWPNDVYIQGKKAAGILVESQDGFAIVGVGLNIASSPEGDDSIALMDVIQDSVSREEVLAVVLDGIFNESSFCSVGFDGQMKRMRQLCWLTGKWVTFQSNQQQQEGRVIGLGDDGSLLVKIDGTEQAFQQAELIRVV